MDILTTPISIDLITPSRRAKTVGIFGTANNVGSDMLKMTGEATGIVLRSLEIANIGLKEAKVDMYLDAVSNIMERGVSKEDAIALMANA